MDKQETHETKTGAATAEAVLMGALAPGVNRSTWLVLKYVMLALGACLAAMLYAALRSSSSTLILHVVALIVLYSLLFLLLSWFLSETGFVSVEEQMKEINLVDKEDNTMKKDT